MTLTEILTKANWNIGYAAVLILLISIVLCSLRFKSLSISIRRLYYFLIWNLIIEISSRILAYSGVQNLPLLHLYTLGEFILLMLFYKSLIRRPAIFQDRFLHFLLLGSGLIIVNSLFFQDVFQFNSYAKTSVQVIIIGLAVLYFYYLIEKTSTLRETRRALRLINSAILIYYSGSLFVFMCSQFSFDNNSELYAAFWVFNAILNLIFQLLILWAISRVVFKKTPLSS